MPILNWLDRDKHVKAAEAVPYRLLEAAVSTNGCLFGGGAAFQPKKTR